MNVNVFKTWERMRSSFWFLPAVMAGGSMALAFLSVTLDKRATDWLVQHWGWTFTGGAEGGSALLGTIAGSMITIAGVVFSMTLVALSLASSQLGPRLLRNFMRDRTTQLVLGTFVATFLYCLLVLRTIRRADEVAFVPHLSITLCVVLSVVSVGVLIYFIHHVSMSMQADEIVARVGNELNREVERLFPQDVGRGAPRTPTSSPDAAFLAVLEREAAPVAAVTDGYLQFVDGNALVALAARKDVVVRLERRPGHYVVAGRPLALVWPGEGSMEQVGDLVRAAFALGNHRTSGQDIEFAVNQLVEIAIRALSPGVNDPYTALTCVDHLGAALCRLVRCEVPSSFRYDAEDQLRVIMPVFTFPDVTDAAFNQIRQYGGSSAAVTIRMLETIAVIAEFAVRPEDRAALLRHAGMIVRGARRELPEEEDRRAVEMHYEAVVQLCAAADEAV